MSHHEQEKIRKETLRKEIEYFSNPQANWMPEWKPAVYRVLLVMASHYYNDGTPISGEMPADFGLRQFTVEDFKAA